MWGNTNLIGKAEFLLTLHLSLACVVLLLHVIDLLTQTLTFVVNGLLLTAQVLKRHGVLLQRVRRLHEVLLTYTHTAQAT